MSLLPKRVIKVGGSLLALPDLPTRLEKWLVMQPPASNLLIVGGGATVDQLRCEYLGTPHDEVALHWHSVHVMDRNASHLAAGLPLFEVCDQLPANEQIPRSAAWIFRVTEWLKHVEPHLPGTNLRSSWDVTSDSIAARVAICWQADALILLKSCNAPHHDAASLATAGYVDAMFAELIAEMPPCQFINLRDASHGG